MEQLPARKSLILQAVIVEYVAGAEPIASELLTVKYDLGVRSATVRNELAEMSEQGFLEQPHTSAGRIPSHRGYRYYVDNILDWRPDSLTEPELSDGRGGEVLSELLHHSICALSRVTGLLSVAATVHGSGVTIKSVIVSAFSAHQALVVVALSNGDVHNRLVECPASLTLQDIGNVNEFLNSELLGKPMRATHRLKVPGEMLRTSAGELAQKTHSALKTISRQISKGKVYFHGEERLYEQPEFRSDATFLTSLLSEIKQTETLFDALHVRQDDAVEVTIGKESRVDVFRDLSIVRQNFFIGTEEAGIIAVIGPTRMDYSKSIPAVHSMANSLSTTLSRLVKE